MNRLLYSSPFVPEEWLTAHGFEPTRFYHGQAATPLTEGRCRFGAAFLAEAKRSAYELVVVTATCDQMRHVPELLPPGKPCFLMHVPRTWQHAEAFKLYRNELMRLSAFLCHAGGVAPPPQHLVASMLDAEMHREQKRGELCGSPGRTPVAITGGPLLAGCDNLSLALDRAGATVALDATESGEMTMPQAFDKRRIHREPFEVLAEAYFSIPDIGRRPNSCYFQYMEREISRRGIRGVIIHRYTWCDLWSAEVKRIKDWSPVPVLDLGGGPSTDAWSNTRIQAFLEMLSG